MGWHWGRWRSPLSLALVPCFNIPSWQHSILMGNMTRSSCPGACAKPEQSMRHIHNWNGIKDSQNETPLGTASWTHWHLDMGLCGMTLPIFLTVPRPPAPVLDHCPPSWQPTSLRDTPLPSCEQSGFSSDLLALTSPCTSIRTCFSWLMVPGSRFLPTPGLAHLPCLEPRLPSWIRKCFFYGFGLPEKSSQLILPGFQEPLIKCFS